MTLQTAATPVWSKSQVASLKECRRKYYFHVKSSEDTTLDASIAEIARLKKMKNRYLWTGSLIHEEIGNLLKLVRQNSARPTLEAFVNSAREKMRTQFKASREGSGNESLFEHHYNIALKSDAWAHQWNQVEQSLRWFWDSKWLARLSVLGPECWKSVDEVLSFDVGGTKTYVKIDCAIETDGRFVLMDWKTSTPKESSQDSLLVAALYAHEVWGAEPEQITASAISLLDGKTFHAHVDADALMETHLKIEEEAALLDQAREEMASATSFSKVAPASMDTCLRCSYQKLCHP